MPVLLQAEGLRKSYDDIVAVDDISFEVHQGEVFGLLGPNGAGKTTIIGCLCGLLKPDRGRIRIDGQDGSDRKAMAAKLGVVPQDLALYDELSVETNLRCFGGLYPGLSGQRLRDRIAWCLDFSRLNDRRDSLVGTLSGGMKRRLNLAVALLSDPPLVLADEPTVGVDPQSRNHIFDSIQTLAQSGKSVLYTTHYMEEVERLCERAAIVDAGRVIACDRLDALRKLADQTNRLSLLLGNRPVTESTVNRLIERFTPLAHAVDGEWLELTFSGDIQLSALVGWFEDNGHPVVEIQSKRASLEDAFLKLTGRSLRDS